MKLFLTLLLLPLLLHAGLLHDAYVQDEVDKDKEMHAHLYTSNWWVPAFAAVLQPACRTYAVKQSCDHTYVLVHASRRIYCVHFVAATAIAPAL